MSKKKCNYVAVGGQALMEGIMMRGPKGTKVKITVSRDGVSIPFDIIRDKRILSSY